MPKKIQLQIPTPCHENWDNMTHVEKGRFCDSCQKKVIDFSNMSDREIAMFFKKPSTNSVCGRFTEEQLNRDIEIPKKRIPWIKYFFQFTLPVFLISTRVTAQKQRPKEKIVNGICSKTVGKVSPFSYSTFNITPKQPQIDISTSLTGIVGFVSSNPVDCIKGNVVDEKGNPMPSATILIKGTKIAVSTDVNGSFIIYPKSKGNEITLVALAIGYNSQETKINRSNYNQHDSIISIAMSPQLTGEVVVVGYATRKAKKEKTVPLLQRIFKDTALKNFNIYPNPVQSNSALHINWNQKDFGYYSLQLFNQAGQLVFTNELYIDEGAWVLTINTPAVPAGSYFLKLTNKTTARSFTEKLVIE